VAIIPLSLHSIIQLLTVIRILCLGDSYTIGESVAASERWPARLAVRLREGGIEVADPVIIAQTGWTTDELDAAISQAKPAGPFDIVTLLIGVNNQYRGRSVQEFREQFHGLLTRAIGLAGGRANHVIVLSIPDWSVTPFAGERDRTAISRQIDAFNSVTRVEAEKAGARYVDVTPVSREATHRPDFIAGDGLHPSGAMYRQWTELVLPEALAAFH
jgi:lysophospholipase L1-like esterase